MFRNAVAVLALAAPLAFAQLGASDPDWKELDAPPPPALRTDKLIALDIPRTELRYGVDPASVTLGADGIVRYVVVARSAAGAVNGIYEGLRCNSGEARVYARHSGEGGWRPTTQSDWRPIHDGAQRHSLWIARNGACMGHVANRSAPQIVRDLASGVDRRYRTDSAR
jgi:hypothetical protein